jgi:hypothetical protein
MPLRGYTDGRGFFLYPCSSVPIRVHPRCCWFSPHALTVTKNKQGAACGLAPFFVPSARKTERVEKSSRNTDKHGCRFAATRMDADFFFIRVHPCQSASIRVAAGFLRTH